MHTESSEATEELGRKIGQNLKGGEIIELVSDLGGGKTTLVRGIAKGLGSKDNVSSPTFTISREYHADKLRIVHYDFYRLQDPGIMSHELAESLEDPHATIIIEWADIVHDVLSGRSRVTITISSTGETQREIQISAPHDLEYVLSKVEL